LQGYPQETVNQVRSMVAANRTAAWLLAKYPQAHGIRTDRALYQHLLAIKDGFIQGGDVVSKVVYDSKLHVVHNALGAHTTVSRVQGARLKAKREIRIASLFKDTPAEFLRMIAVHELAHLRERNHDKAFYQLCTYMEPRYHQIEFEVRVYLTHLEATGQRLWAAQPIAQPVAHS
jgi:predicted metal-dependent hydrolase